MPHSDMSFNERRITIESGFTFSFFPPPSFNSPSRFSFLPLSLVATLVIPRFPSLFASSSSVTFLLSMGPRVFHLASPGIRARRFRRAASKNTRGGAVV